MSRPRKPVRLVRIRGKENWYVRDRRQVLSTGTTDEEAAQCFLNQYLDLKDAPQRPSISTLLDIRLSELQANERARASNTPYYHKALREHFGPLQPADISVRLLKEYREKRKKTPTALREELIELRATLRMAERTKLISEFPYIEIPAKRPPRENFLTRSQADRLMAAATTPHLWLFIAIATATGARRGAILGLTWDRVDLERGRINFTDPERAITKKRRTVAPIGSSLVESLQSAKTTAETPFVIEYMGAPIKDIKRSFAVAVQRSGLPAWTTPHILKHSVVSWLAEDGYSVDEISDLTATHHNTVRRIYRKFSPRYLEKMAKSLDRDFSFANQFAKPTL